MKEKFTTYRTTILLGSLPEFAHNDWTSDEWDRHYAYVEELKLSGQYMKPHVFEISIMHDDIYDNIKTIEKPLSYRYEILDLSK